MTLVRLIVDDTQVIDAVCTDGTLETPALKSGTHTLVLEAVGELGDTAGSAQLSGTIKTKAQAVLDPVSLDTLAPITTLRPTWQLQSGGQPTTCAALASTGVRINTTPQGSVATSDIFNCTEQAAAVAVVYGPFTVSADVLGVADAVLASSAPQSFGPRRGDVPAAFAIGQ